MRKAFLATAMALGITVSTAPAHADATDCSSWAASNRNYANVYCATLAGRSDYVNYAYGKFRGYDSICNWNITAEFFDRNWNWYRTYQGARHPGCATSGNDTIRVQQYMREGYMCSTFKSNGTRLSSACVRIYIQR